MKLQGIGWAVVEGWHNTIVRGDLLFEDAEALAAKWSDEYRYLVLDIVPTDEALHTYRLRDDDYDDEGDRRMCAQCPYIAYGGSMATMYEIHDHVKQEHQ